MPATATSLRSKKSCPIAWARSVSIVPGKKGAGRVVIDYAIWIIWISCSPNCARKLVRRER